jgi:hypothetical protein
MPEVVASPAPAAPPKQEPTKIPPPVAAGVQGAAALADGDKGTPTAEDPLEFELDVKGQKQKVKFRDREQMKAALQKAFYADQVIKDGIQAKKGAEALMAKLKTKDGLRQVLADPDVNLDVKQFAIDIVKEMMDDEKLTPEQREALDLKARAEKAEGTLAEQKKAEADRIAQEKFQKDRAAMSASLIEAMKKYPDIPQNQATMDAMILNMRAAFKRFGMHLTPDQAMSVYSEQYWNAHKGLLDKMTDEQLLARFGQKTLDRLQALKLKELKAKTDPSKQKSNGDSSGAKKKHMTEKEFDHHFKELAGL